MIKWLKVELFSLSVTLNSLKSDWCFFSSTLQYQYFKQILSTNYLRKCMEIRVENLYINIVASVQG